MSKKGKAVIMLLAGGQGSRLKSMTADIAKPAVSFGGKYRIIDFALSNSTNSGILDIGVLTQYRPHVLNTHIGIGSAWDYDRNHGGLRVLSPFMSEDGGRWYTGTANAIYENLDYLDSVDCEYVIVLSADHIYKMDYSVLLKYHKEKGAQATVAVIEVPMEEAHRFGIVNTDEEQKIVEFEEKPEHPKNNTASMGIYVFDYDVLRKYLVEDDKDASSDHDFGKNVLPKMLHDGIRMYAYVFDGYWKDVGTVRSYWEANMDLLDPDNPLKLQDRSWRIFTASKNLPPHYIRPGSKVENSLINEGCDIAGNVKNSVLFSNVTVEEGAEVSDSVIMSNCVIKKGAKLHRVILLENLTIDPEKEIGSDDDAVYLVSRDSIIKE